MKLKKKDTPKPMVESMSISSSTATKPPTIRTTSSTFLKVADFLSRILLPLLVVLSVLLMLLLLPVKAFASESNVSNTSSSSGSLSPNLIRNVSPYTLESLQPNAGSAGIYVNSLLGKTETYGSLAGRPVFNVVDDTYDQITVPAAYQFDAFTILDTLYYWYDVENDDSTIVDLSHTIPTLMAYSQWSSPVTVSVGFEYTCVSAGLVPSFTSALHSFSNYQPTGSLYEFSDLVSNAIEDEMYNQFVQTGLYAVRNITITILFPAPVYERTYRVRYPHTDTLYAYYEAILSFASQDAYDEGYSEGYGDGYWLGYEEGEFEGYADGYREGLAVGESIQPTGVDWFLRILDAVMEFPLVRFTPDSALTVGNVIGLCLGVPLLIWFLKMFAGG